MSTTKSIKSKVEFRAVPGFPGYRVGDDGTVWSRWIRGCSKMRKDWKKLKLRINSKGRQIVQLYRNGKRYMCQVHRLVLEAFIGPCPDEMQCAHWDGNPTNNRLENLRWTTAKENMADCIRHGTASRGERQGSSKLTEKQVLEIRKLREQGAMLKTIGDLFGITCMCVSLICNRRAWKHV